MKKKIYTTPEICEIILDNAISLILESEPPTFESNNLLIYPDYFSNEVFRSSNSEIS